MKLNALSLTSLYLFLLLVSSIKAQKPEIQVNFAIKTDIVFQDTFDGKLEEIKSEALPLLINGLNEYIGFAKFTSDTASNKLEITLKSKSGGGMGFVQEYWLFFDLTDTDGNVYQHEWQFLDNDEFNAVKSSTDALLQKLQQDWVPYLEKAYNNELVTHLFDEISLSLPDSTHYYIDAVSGIKEAILPFKKETLRINPDKSEFLVIITGEMGNGVPTTSTEPIAHASGVVVPSMPGVPAPLEGCIRIELKTLSLNRFLSGQVYITSYTRKNYDSESIATPGAFLESNPERP